jgi:hypothetical protein
VGAANAGSMFGKYQLNRLLGQGGMGEVYEAHDTSKDRTAALKILPEELSRDEGFRTRFQRDRVPRRCWRSRMSSRFMTGVRSTEICTSICDWCAAKICMSCFSAGLLSRSARSGSSARSGQRWMLRTRKV